MKFPINKERAVDIAALLLRASSAIMLTHGWKKLSHFSEMVGKFSDPLHIGSTTSLSLTVFAEFLCTLFLLLGLFTRIATLPLIFTFCVIVFLVHSGDPFGEKELAVVYLLQYLVLFFLGPGRFSLDHWVRKKA